MHPGKDLLLEKNMIDRQTWKKMFEDAAEPQAIPTTEQTSETRHLSEDEIPIELIVSEQATKAWIKNKKPLLDDVDTTIVKALLEKKGVVSGIIPDEKIAKINGTSGRRRKWIVAETVINIGNRR